jgi:uncharacterized protein (DUF1778 family)
MVRKRKNTGEVKEKTLVIRLTVADHTFIKMLATQRNITMGNFVLEAVRHYVKERT